MCKPGNKWVGMGVSGNTYLKGRGDSRILLTRKQRRELWMELFRQGRRRDEWEDESVGCGRMNQNKET